MIEAVSGGTVLLELVASDGDATLFPQAEIYTSAGALSSTVDLTHTANGIYQATTAAPAVGKYSVLFISYKDATHTILANFSRLADQLSVFVATEDQVWDAVRGVHTTPNTFGQALDAQISTRSTHTASDVDALVTASHGVGSYLSATGFAVAGDAMTLTAGERAAIADSVWDETQIGHVTAGTFGAALDADVSSRATQAQILSDATPFPGARVDATISSRATASAVDSTLSASHGAGTWTSAVSVDWTQAEREQIRYALGVAGVQTLPSGTFSNLGDVLADTAAMQPLVSANLDATVSSRAATGDAMALTTTERATTVDAVWDEPIAGHLTAGTAGQKLNDASATPPSQIADAVWDELRAGHSAAGTFGQIMQTQPAVAGDAMALTANALTSASLDASAAVEIRDQILSDGVKFAGANIDTTVSSRSSHDAATAANAVWGTQLPGTFLANSAGEKLDTVDSVTSTQLDAPVSSRSSHTAAAVDALVTTSHGVGSYLTASPVSDWTATEQSQIRGALGIVGTQTAPAGGGDLQSVLADTAAMQPTIASNLDAAVTTRAVAGDAMTLTSGERTATAGAVWDEALPGTHAAGTAGERLATVDGLVDVATSTRATEAGIAAALGAAHGNGSWESATSQSIRDAMKLAPSVGAPVAGSVDEHLDEILADTAAVDARLPADPADESNQLAQHAATQAAIAALNDIDQATVQLALTAQGYTTSRAPKIDNLDGAVSAVLAAIAALNDLTAAEVENAVWDAARSAHTTLGSAMEGVIAAAGHAGMHSVLDGGSGNANIVTNSNNNLTSARLRIFATKALADAAIPGAADAADSELLRLNVAGAVYAAGSLTATPEILTSIKRTSS